MRPTSLFAFLLAATTAAAQETPATPSETAPIPVKPEPRPERPAPEQPEPLESQTSDAPLASAEAPELQPVADPNQQRLVNGAPLHNPNVAVHVVQKKRFADEGRHEFTLYPVVGQVNGRFTQHAGSALHYTYHLQENFGLQVSTTYNWYSNESLFNLELIDKVREQAQAASALLLLWGAQAGVEVTPLYGKFAFYDNHLLQFSLVLSGGAGIGSTRVLIRPEVSNQVDGESFTVPARFGDTGTKFLGSVGGGFRVQFGDSMALRLEVRDLVYTARVDRVDGCNLQDFQKLEDARGNGRPFSELGLSGSCQFQKFDGVDPKTRKNYREDIVLGKDLVGNPSSDVLNNLSFYAGFSLLF
ncbi:outer membrane beta-barrel domain-containing protein [Archangium sp.]|uniref:outer membrane beta-barrel domain-containing protein n=1 Tax=Archangium sp. TaxID=1872627 RepID=UPI002D395504|nr:outer membrane beta-barrel domain-containing protein [Archangium sp.]HYO51905.1 outer membrane beta-barrel domain-containing protein [Archangium sp.]